MQMFLMPSAACCSDTSFSLGTTGIAVVEMLEVPRAQMRLLLFRVEM
jgi:hypothetical protein